MGGGAGARPGAEEVAEVVAEVEEENATLELELEATRRRAAALHAQSEGEVRALAGLF